MGSLKLPLVLLIAVCAADLVWGQASTGAITKFEVCTTPIPGQDVTLYCSGRDFGGKNPNRTLSWSASGNSFPSTIVYAQDVQPAHTKNLSIHYFWKTPNWGYDLTIKKFSAKHNGRYQCEILNLREGVRLQAVTVQNWDFITLEGNRLTLNTGTNDTVKFLTLTEVTSKEKSYVHADGEIADSSDLSSGVYSVEACFCGDPSKTYISFGCHAVRSLIVDCNPDKAGTLWKASVALLVIALITVLTVVVFIVISYRKRTSSDKKAKLLMHGLAAWVLLLFIGTLILAGYVTAAKLDYVGELGEMAPASGPPATGTTIPPPQPTYDPVKAKCEDAESKLKQAVGLGWVAFAFAVVALVGLVVYGVAARKWRKGNKESAEAYGDSGDKNGSEGVDDKFLPEKDHSGSA